MYRDAGNIAATLPWLPVMLPPLILHLFMYDTHIYGGLLVILFRLRCLCAALDILLYAKKVNEYVVDEINEL